MISYSDYHFGSGDPSSAWKEADRRLFEAMHATGQEFGDEVHTSGPVDYLVRVLENVNDITVREKVPNYFLILVSSDGIDTVTKVGNEEPSRGGALTFQEPWKNEICDRFRAFRQRLG